MKKITTSVALIMIPVLAIVLYLLLNERYEELMIFVNVVTAILVGLGLLVVSMMIYEMLARAEEPPVRYCECNNELTDPEMDVCGDCR